MNLIIGSFGSGNLGDEMILLSALKKHPNSIFMTADENFSQTFTKQKFENIKPFPTGFGSFVGFFINKKERTKYLNLNKKIEQIIFAGGGLFSRNFKAVWIWSLIVFWCKYFFPTAKIKMESQGIDFPNNFLSKFLLEKSLKNIDEISVRDSVSRENILKILSNKKVKIIGDAVENFLQKQIFENKKEKFILVNAINYFDYEKLNKKIVQKFPNYKTIFVCFDKKDEKIAKKLNLNYQYPKTFFTLINLFIKAEFFIGQRFHFLILAKKLAKSLDKVFLLNKPYAPKTKIFANENNLKSI